MSKPFKKTLLLYFFATCEWLSVHRSQWSYTRLCGLGDQGGKLAVKQASFSLWAARAYRRVGVHDMTIQSSVKILYLVWTNKVRCLPEISRAFVCRRKRTSRYYWRCLQDDLGAFTMKGYDNKSYTYYANVVCLRYISTESWQGKSCKSVCVYNVISEILPFALSDKALGIPVTFLL